ncbi:ybbM seven transmembrane helix protein [Vibrio ishigakensis]|uniref:YbbM seven transmembrane helix protein n=1 Tax=Vibrio ishigakensis TaxID=1481914 RepID=A0A0B8PD44_9VIBR|nr:ybbM seven transmembrane helix protein [Vibrio ishigakensis]
MLLALFSLTLIVPFSINRHFQLSLGKDIVLSVMRMTAQLILIGLYLEYLFDLNNLWVNMAWIAIMIGVGASAS